jgi:hypothetical protein
MEKRYAEARVNMNREWMNSLPRRVAWNDIPQFERLDDRVAAVNIAAGAIVDVTRGYVALTTDDAPTEEELLAWAWLIRPDLEEQVMLLANGDLREAIESYHEP